MSNIVGGEMQDSKDEMKKAMNDIFTEVIQNNSWKGQEYMISKFYKNNPDDFTEATQSIMLKIMMIPGNQKAHSEQISRLFLKIYEVLLKQFKTQEQDSLQPFFQAHMINAFKLTQHQQKNVQQRAYQWLEAVIENAPINFLSTQKGRIIKSLFTNTLNQAESDSQNKAESIKYNAIRISAKLYDAVKEKGKDEYAKSIINHLIKIMMEDDNDLVRKECITRIELNSQSIPFIAMKTEDVSSRVRCEVFKQLRDRYSGNFDDFLNPIKINLIVNGLKDKNQEVRENCKEFLTQQLCAKNGEMPTLEKKPSGASFFQRSKRVYQSSQLNPILKIVQSLSISETYNDPQISTALYLLLKEVVFPVYGLDEVFHALETINTQLISKRIQSIQYDSLFEELIFLNFSLNIIKENIYQHQRYSYSYLQLNIHLPSLKLVAKLIEHFQKAEYEYNNQYQEILPNLIINQGLNLFNHLIAKFKSDLNKQEMAQIITTFILNKNFFSVEEEYKEVLDSVEKMHEEQKISSKFEIGIRDRELLILIGVRILEQIHCLEYETFLRSMTENIVQLRTDLSIEKEKQDLQKTYQKIQTYEKSISLMMAQMQKKQEENKEPPTEKELLKLANEKDKLKKYQSMTLKIPKKGLNILQHQLLILKYFLKVTKIGSCNQSFVNKSFDFIIDQNMHSEHPRVKTLAFESLSLLMIHDRSFFDNKLLVLIEQIESEEENDQKSDVYRVCLNCILDGIIVHTFLLESGSLQDLLRYDLRKLLMQQLADKDYSIRLLMAEGLCKVLLNERVSNPWEFIASLTLMYFESLSQDTESLTEYQIRYNRRIQCLINQFFIQSTRLSYDRCCELFEGTIAALYYLIKSRVENKNLQQYNKINVYLMFGQISELLQLKQNKQNAIFDLQEQGISFQYQYIRFFSFMIFSDNIPKEEQEAFKNFFIHSLSFFDLEEIPYVICDFEKEFKDKINPLMSKLHQFYMNTGREFLIEQQWRKIIAIYNKKTQDPLTATTESKVMSDAILADKSIQFEEDEVQVLQHCNQFYKQMFNCGIKNKVDIDYAQYLTPGISTTGKEYNNYPFLSQQALKILQRIQTPNITKLLKEASKQSFADKKEKPKVALSKKRSVMKEETKKSEVDKKRDQKGVEKVRVKQEKAQKDQQDRNNDDIQKFVDAHTFSGKDKLSTNMITVIPEQKEPDSSIEIISNNSDMIISKPKFTK